MIRILQNCFQANKPAYLTLPPKKPHGLEGEEGDDALKDGKKKPKWNKDGGKEKFQYQYQYRDLGTMVHNGTQPVEWKLPGFKYQAIFTPEIISLLPLSMLQVSSHATNGISKVSAMRSAIASLPRKTLILHPTNLRLTNGSRI
jgi:hypothetical protein